MNCFQVSTLSPAPPLWLRYFGDVLLIWPNGEDFGSFLANVNALSNSMNSLLSGKREKKFLFWILLLTDYFQASASRLIVSPHTSALICIIFQDTVNK